MVGLSGHVLPREGSRRLSESMDPDTQGKGSLFPYPRFPGRRPLGYQCRWGLEPASACDHEYLESAFGYDQAYFLKTIGTVNMAEMHQKLVDNPRQRQNDTEMLKTIESIAQGWFKCGLLDLPLEKKARLLPYIYRSFRTSIAQLARCFGLDPDKVARMVGKPGPAAKSHPDEGDEGKTEG